MSLRRKVGKGCLVRLRREIGCLAVCLSGYAGRGVREGAEAGASEKGFSQGVSEKGFRQGSQRRGLGRGCQARLNYTFPRLRWGVLQSRYGQIIQGHYTVNPVVRGTVRF